MSRNFDLLAEVERERDANAKSAKAQLLNVRAAQTDFATRDFSENGGIEMLHLVNNVFLSANADSPHQVVFCGVDDNCGSSAVCANAARILAAKSAKSVCLVDANLRLPRLTGLLEVNKTIQLSPPSPVIPDKSVEVGGNLWLVNTGFLTDSNGALLPLDDLRPRIKQLNDSFEYLLIDAPATSVSGDAAIIGQLVDAAILVIEAGRTRRLNAGKAKEAFDAAGVQLLGTVLRNRSFPIPEKLYKWL